ncbi:sulfotransferase [Sulfuricurvum sp.]|uniref:sulfotransferase family protein n=1 Tax=Sulfuricurvum sp. TaxID=2025608 RepID=UPI00260E3FDC|nr:sulfotransferase [Sulfuricurvum sp.]MDD3596411.1 sulfotransferase [Sulfuricurvum sp.]
METKSFLNTDDSFDSHNIHFIVGTGRCGTTILARILNNHSEVVVPHELQILFEISNNGKRLYEFFDEGTAQQWDAEEFIKHISRMCPHDFQKYFDYKSFFTNYTYPVVSLAKMVSDMYHEIARSRHKRIFLEQTPWYGLRLDIIKSIFPQAKIIHILRDGRDVALSFSKTPWWHDDPEENLERWSQEITTISNDLQTLFSSDKYIEVRYEDLVNDPANVLKDICVFLDIEFEETMLNPQSLIDYSLYKKRKDGESISSNEYEKWENEKEKITFSDNVYGWKKSAVFSCLSEEVRSSLNRYQYDTNP